MPLSKYEEINELIYSDIPYRVEDDMLKIGSVGVKKHSDNYGMTDWDY